MFDISLKRVSPLGCTRAKYDLIITAPAKIAQCLRCSFPAFLNSYDGNIVCEVKVLCNGVKELPAPGCTKNAGFVLSNIIPIKSGESRNTGCSSCSANLACGWDEDIFDMGCGRKVEKNNGCQCYDPLSDLYGYESEMQEGCIVVRACDPCMAKFLCQYPLVFLTDDEETLKLIFVYDKCGSANPCLCQNQCGCSGCSGCAGYGYGAGWGFEWFIILLIIFGFGGWGTFGLW